MSDLVSISKQSNTLDENQNYPWHQSTWEKFAKAKSNKQLPHAILLSGEEGIAKHFLSQQMAKSLLCIHAAYSQTATCNECLACKTYESGANPDFIEISLLEGKQQIGVDQIRALSDFLHYSRSYNTHRVVILNPVERMNINAANSLLKSLEEPSAHTVIILVTTKMNQLLPTIKSRCQLYNLPTPTKDESLTWLKNNQHHENAIDPEILLKMSGSKPLKAINISQQDIDSRNQFFKDLINVIQNQLSLTEMAKKWEKYDVEILLNWQLSIVQNTIKSNLTFEQSEAITANTANGNNPLTQHMSSEEHWCLYQNLIDQKQFIHTSVNSLMFMENMIMLWTKNI